MPRLRALMLLISFAILLGCTASAPYPEKDLYALDAGPAPDLVAAAPDTTLRVSPALVLAPYDSRFFQYEVAEGQIEPDYYANFASRPQRLLTNQLIEYLSEAGLYEAVVDAESRAPATFELESRFTELYADLTDPQEPVAIIRARFMLFDDARATGRIVFQRGYEARSAAASTRPADLVKAWNDALTQMLESLARDLADIREVELRP